VATSLSTGHCAGKVAFIDWPGWAGRPKEQVGAGASILTLSSDKTSYSVGQTANLAFTSPGKGRALVSLIQPHQCRKNDLPLRLYGILPLPVDDPYSRLSPVVSTPSEMRPNQNLSITVREAAGKPMTYTVAVVDECLLGLTGHATPDPRASFRQKQLAGTWWSPASPGAGQSQAAQELVRSRSLAISYVEPGETFGSVLRDQAVAVYTLARQGRTKEAMPGTLALADSLLAPQASLNTQSRAWSLLASDDRSREATTSVASRQFRN